MTHTFVDTDWQDAHTNIFQEDYIHENLQHISKLKKHCDKTQQRLPSLVDIYHREERIYWRLGSCLKTLFVPSNEDSVEQSIKLEGETELESHHTIGHHSSENVNIAQSQQKNANLIQSFSPDNNLDSLLGNNRLHDSADEISTRYLKIKSKYVTDGQGVVNGMLLVTPQTIMFNPCVSDHLVMDRGHDMYIVRTSLKAVSGITFFEDIAAMVLGDLSQEYVPMTNCMVFDSKYVHLPKPGTIICENSGKEFLLSPKFNKKERFHSDDNTLNDLDLTQADQNISLTDHNVGNQVREYNVQKNQQTEQSAVISASSDQGIGSDLSTDATITEVMNTQESDDTNDPEENKQDLSVFMAESHSSSTPKHSASDQLQDTSLCDNKAYASDSNEVFCPSDVASIDASSRNTLNGETGNQSQHLTMSPQHCDASKDSGISEGNATTSTSLLDSHDADHFFHEPLSNRSSLSNEAQQWLGKRGVRLPSMESKDNFPEEIFPRPAAKHEESLMYVAIKIHKSYWFTNRTKQNHVMGIPPNRDQKRHQHWFAIPKHRVDQFYSFLLHWVPDFEAIASGASTPCSEDYHDSEEKVTKDDAEIMKFRVGSLNSLSSKTSLRSLEEDPPDLISDSTLLTKLQIKLLARSLPKRTVGHSWELVYSTNLHGTSLSTLYRNFQDYDNPSLVIVKEENGKLFGAFLSESPKLSDGFYGTGESMLFTFVTDNKLTPYHWSGENHFFIKGSKSSFVIGGGEGVFGLWIDEDLYHGRSHSCRTFDNETLSENEDFICNSLEAWAFV